MLGHGLQDRATTGDGGEFEGLTPKLDGECCYVLSWCKLCWQSKVKILEPIKYNIIHDAKMFKNFAWDHEHYFETTRIPKDEQVATTIMYLTNNTKLWWHTRVNLRSIR